MGEVSVILPTYEEHDTVGDVLVDVCDELSTQLSTADLDHELVVVDDSPDSRTAEAVRDVQASHDCVRLIRRMNGTGLGTAVARGIRESEGEIVVVMDADGQHPPRAVPQLVSDVDRGADISVGSRHAGGSNMADWSTRRYIMSFGASVLAWFAVPDSRPLQDPMSGFFAAQRSSVIGVMERLNPEGYKILLEVLARAPIDVVSERAITFQPRGGGESKTDAGEMGRYLSHLASLAVASRTHTRPGRLQQSAEVADERA